MIKAEIDKGNPCIILIDWGLLKYHYVNVVGYKEDCLLIQDYHGVYQLKLEDLETLSYNRLPFMSAYRIITLRKKIEKGTNLIWSHNFYTILSCTVFKVIWKQLLLWIPWLVLGKFKSIFLKNNENKE